MKISHQFFRPRSRALALEPRILFDGAAAVAAEQHFNDGQSVADNHQRAGIATERSLNDANTSPPESQADQEPLVGKTVASDESGIHLERSGGDNARNLVVIDQNIAGWEQLLAGMPASSETLLIAADEDGVARVSDYLAQQAGSYDAIHLFSHGSSGQFALGNRTVDSENLAKNAADFTNWATHLTVGADLLVYGCDTGAGEQGQLLINELARLTTVDVAASTDTTGAGSQGGDWVLERQTGAIETPAFALVGFEGVLAAPTITDSASSRSVAEDNTLSITGITIADTDGGNSQTVTITTTNGTMTLATTANTASLTGDGTNSLSFVASASNATTAINGMVFRPNKDFSGTATFTVATNDGTTSVSLGTKNITVNANPTAPLFTLPTTAQTLAEDVASYLDFTDANAIVLTDADTNDLQTLTLSVAHGVLNVTAVGGATVTSGNGSASVVLSGTDTQLSATLASATGMQYISALNYNSSAGLGAEALSFNLNDGVHTQSGTITLNVTQVNDAPNLSTGVAATLPEGSSVALSRAQLATSDNALDVDIQTGQQVAAQLMVKIDSLPASGTLSYNNGVIVVGSVVPVNALGNLTYTHNGSDITTNQTDSFNVTVSDGGGGATAGTVNVTITPKNVAPSISGTPSLIEGQVKVVAPSINLGDGFDTLANSTVVIDNIINGSQGTLFIDADNDNVVDGGEEITVSTTLTETQRSNLGIQLKFFQNGAEPNAPGAIAPSFRITVTDAGGGTGTPSAAVAETITIEVLPNNDDPTLTNAHPNAGSALAVVEGTKTTIITAAMLAIADADRDPANTANTTPSNQLVFTIGTRPTQGEVQLFIGGGVGPESDGWIVLGDNGRFTQAQITAGSVRYYQTTNIAAVTADQFTFTVRDSAFGYDVWTDPANPTSGREGGLRDTPTGAIATKEFHFNITPDTRVVTYEGNPRPATSGYGDTSTPMVYSFTPTGGMLSNNSTAGGTWVEANVGAAEGGYVITSTMLSYTITRTDTKGTPGDNSDDVSVTVPSNETVYTLTSQPPNGKVQTKVSGSWTDIPTNGQFTQADINANNIRFVHDGGEDHASTFGYKVSDGTPNNYTATFGIDITPTNDRPTGNSSSAAQVTEGNGNAVRLTGSTIGMSDLDNSLDSKGGEGLQDFLWFKVTGLAVDGSSAARGTLQRWDGDSWETVDINTWLPSTLLSATVDGGTSGLRYIHDGSEPLAYSGGAKVTFNFVVRDDLANPSDPLATNATAPTDVTGSAQSNQSTSVTATINIIPVNNAPIIADKPADADPTIGGTITNGGVLTGVNEILTIAVEGGDSVIDSSYLVGVDSDNTTVQRQFIVKTAPTQGILLLNDKLLGVGSTFTQDDINNNRVKYRHNGNEIATPTTDSLGTYNDKFHFVLSDAVFDDTGTSTPNWNTFLITLTPTNDAPTINGPSGIILIDSADAAKNPVTGFVVADPDLTDNVLAGQESDFVQATVRLLDASGNPITDYTAGFAGGGVSFGYTAQAGGLWAVTQNGSNNILQIQGNRAQVNAALAGLTVTFANDTNSTYKLQVIVDDRMRDGTGALVTTASDANGGELNQGATAGAVPTAVPTTEYNWVTQATLAATDPNIAATTVDLRASLVNEPATLTGTTAQTLYEDARTQITGDFDIADPESAAFNTPVTVTLSVGSGTLDVAGANAQTSFTPSGGQAVSIGGDTTATINLTGRAADIKALLNARNFANDAADSNGGLFYKSASNVNHDTNGASDGDVTLTVALADTGSVFGSDVGAGSVSNNPASITRAITITPVNDAPTVSATAAAVAISGNTAVTGFVVNELDNTDGSALASTPGETDFMQVTVRLLPATGTTPLDAGAHANVVFSSSTPGTVAVDSSYDGIGKALVIRGSVAEVNTYLAGLQVALSGALLNDNASYRVQVVADDRLRTTGAGGGALDGSNAANGGKNTDGSTGVADVPTTAVDPYAALPTLTYNLASNTRGILGSNINEAPSFALLDSTPTFAENGAAVVLDANATVSDPELTTYSNWNGAVLTLTRGTGANSDDVFSLTGSGSTGINFNGGNIRNSSTVVGTFTNAGGTLAITFNASASNTVVNSVLQAIKYSNTNNNPPTSVTINYTINDGDTDADRAGNGQGTGGPLTGTGSISVGITPTNDAPTLTGLTGKTFTENGSPVVIGSNAVPGDPELTVFATNAGNWGNASMTISRNGGANVEDNFSASGTLSALTEGSPLTDGATTIGAITTNSAGTLKITFAEDVTTAQVQAAIRQIAYSNSRETLAAADSASVTLNWLLEDGDTDADRATNPQGTGGNKSVTVAQTITLSGVNDAPVLADSVLTLSQAEDAVAPVGAVGSLVSALAAANISDVDASAVKGLAITATDSSHGTWHYSINGGTNWTAFTATDGTARLLAADANTRVYFQPTGNWHGGPIAAALTVRAWDKTTGSNGGTADLSVPGTSTGSATAFSSATDTVALTVTPVNDAPSLSGTKTLPDVTEDNTSPAITAANIATALTYSDATDDQTASSGGTTATAHTALAIVGNAATAAQGTWQYTLNNGTLWTPVPTTVSNTTSIVLDLANADHQVRFVPVLNFAGVPGNLSLRASDGTWNSITGIQDISALVGGTGAWSADTGALAISVTAVNDPPVATDDTNSITENTASVSGNVKTGTGGTLDTDPDTVNAGLSITALRTGTEGAGTGTNIPLAAAFTTTYGSLTLSGDGSYTYTLDNTNPVVNALIAGEALTEVFTYTLSDGALTDTAQLTITINGATDGAPTVTPVDGNAAATGQAEVYESGLTVDGPGGQSKTTTGTITLAAPEGLKTVSVGGTSFTVAELTSFTVGVPSAIIDTGEGELRLTGLANVVGPAAKPTAADLAYTYTLKATQNQAAAAESTDTIALLITDVRTTTATGNGTLTVRIVDDAPTANADTNTVTEGVTTAGTLSGGGTITGDVFPATTSGGDVADRIGADTTPVNPVTHVIKGNFTPTAGVTAGTNSATGTTVAGDYGSLKLGADGTYSYTLDNTSTTVDAMQVGSTVLTDVFSYRITDADGETSDTTLTISINGANDGPIAVDDTHAVTEDSGTPSTGDAIAGTGSPNTAADSDPDNVIGELSLSGIRTGNEAAGGAMTAITAASTSASGGTVVTGQYGTLTIGADGSYSYALDNTNPTVNALKTAESLTEIFSYTLKDPGNLSDTAQISIIINGHTDGGALAISPVDGNAAATGQASVYESGLTSNGPTLQPKTTTGSILVDAPEGIASITVGGTTLTVAQLAVLSVASPSAIIDTGEGELRITGIAVTTGSTAAPTAAQVSYTYTLKSTITNALPADTEKTDTIALLVTDKSAGAVTASGNLLIQIVDDTPTANPDTNSITKGSASVAGNVVTTGTGIDRIGADTTATPVTALTGVTGAYGNLTLATDGSYTYALDNSNATISNLQGGQTKTDIFTYTIIDTDGDTSTTTLTITINGVTPPPPDFVPVAVNDSFAPTEDTPFSATLVTNDTSSADGGNVWTKASNPTHGTVTVNPDGTFTYTPTTGYSGPDSFTYTITDADGDTSSATVTLTVAPVDEVPVAVNDQFAVNFETPISGTLKTNDTPSGDGGNVWTKASNPTHGTVTVNPDGTFTYTPTTGYSGPDSFTYTITDADGDTSSATVTLTVAPVDEVPVAVNDQFAVNFETPISGTLKTNDTPSGDGGNVWTKASNPTHGTVTVNPDGTFTYTPTTGYSGPDSFTYTITDADGDTSSATVTLTVAPVDEVPVAVNDQFAVNFETPISGTLKTNDTPSGDGGNVWTKASNPTHGTVTVNPDGTFTYTPTTGYSGPDSFTYTITDADGDTSTATVTLTVAPVDEVPVAVNDQFAVNFETPISSTLKTNDTPSGDGGNVWTKASNPTHGTVTVNPDGTFTYTPTTGYSGPDSFTYTITDADGDTSSATVTLTVAPVDEVPVAVNDQFAVNFETPISGTLKTNDTPSGDGGNVWTKTTDPLHGTLVVNPDGTFTYTPTTGYSGPDSFTYTITDADGDTSTATVALNIASQPPNPPLPLLPQVESLGSTSFPGISQPELQNAIRFSGEQAREPSVFFDGSTFEKILRLPIPFHPIVYVSRAVTFVQEERSTYDPRTFSNPDWVLFKGIRSQSIGATLGVDPHLFVTPSVRDTQAQGEFLSAVVYGRLSRISLSADWLIPTADLFQPEIHANQSGNRDQAPTATAGPLPAEIASSAPSEEENRVDTADDQVLTPRVALSFSEQLLASQRRQNPAELHHNYL